MSFKQPYSTSLRSVGSYQVSGRPWVKGGLNASSSQVKIELPFVSRWIVITNNAATTAQLSFAADGGGVGDGFYLEIPGNSTSPRLEIKCVEFFLDGGHNSACLSVMAGLTNIPREQMYALSGDGVSA